MRVGEMVYNILKGVEEKRAVGTQRFYKGGWGTLGQGVGLSASKSHHFLWYLYYVLPLNSTSANYREVGRS